MRKTKVVRIIWCEFCSTSHPEDWHARVKAGDLRPMYLTDVTYRRDYAEPYPEDPEDRAQRYWEAN